MTHIMKYTIPIASWRQLLDEYTHIGISALIVLMRFNVINKRLFIPPTLCFEEFFPYFKSDFIQLHFQHWGAV